MSKRIEFCYGHRLLDYDGICKHPHGHNAVAEIEVRSGVLDGRNMVCDFGDIKRVVKGWIDREIDHKMILRRDDPLVQPLQQLHEPIYIVDSNPTVERIAKLIFDSRERRLKQRREQGRRDALAAAEPEGEGEAVAPAAGGERSPSGVRLGASPIRRDRTAPPGDGPLLLRPATCR